jgi:hypothetical protein
MSKRTAAPLEWDTVKMKYCPTCEVEGMFGGETNCVDCDTPLIPMVLITAVKHAAYEAEHELLKVILKDCPTLIVCYYKGRDLKEWTKEAIAAVDAAKGQTK